MTARSPAETIRQIPVDLIRPGSQQARRHFDAAALAELSQSIRESGVIQPVVLRTRVWGFELLAGERRWRAAQAAGLHDIPALVRDDLSDTEAFVLGLIENLQRESLTPMEAASGMKRLGEVFDLTHEQIGRRIGKSRAYVSNFLRLLNLTPEVAVLVNEGHLTLGHAKILAGLALRDQVGMADEVVRRKLTVRGLEKRIATMRDSRIRFEPAGRAGKSGDLSALERALADHLGYPVSVTSEAGGSGELRIRFHSIDELQGLLERIGYRAE